MKPLGRLSPRARVLAAFGYTATAALTLAIWWVQLWPNLVADGVAGVPAVVAASGLLVRRAKHEVAQHVAEHVERQLAEHRDQIKAHIDQALAARPPEATP
ncbi:MAG TPA: hypothetical protein VN088_15740 [Nocardioides sp.]|nr:hypothetical protein [Nocardioides sp.]